MSRTPSSHCLDLTQGHILAGYDAPHRACAVAANDVLTVASLPALTIVPVDDGLLGAAIAEGLQVENPSRP